jgi:hypothetical protein
MRVLPPAGAPLFNNTMFCHSSSCYFYRSTAADYYTAREACADIGAGVGDLVVYGTEAEHWRVERYMFVKVRGGAGVSRCLLVQPCAQTDSKTHQSTAFCTRVLLDMAQRCSVAVLAHPCAFTAAALSCLQSAPTQTDTW